MTDELITSQFLGMNPTFIDFHSLEQPLHEQVIEPAKQLKVHAREAGFDVTVVSGYRDFSRQLLIWNNKASGKRPLLSSDEKPIDITTLSPKQRVFAILRWSALPGTTRHHWGTDFDVVDMAAIDDQYAIQLTKQETEKGGVFAEMHSWLTSYLSSPSTPFYRPYSIDRGGVSPEPWHLSYKPLAEEFEKTVSKSFIIEKIKHTDLYLKDVVLEHFDEIFERFVLNK